MIKVNNTIRKADIEDFDGIKNLLETVDLPVEGVLANIDHFIVMLSGNEIVGTVGLEVFGTEGLLRSIAVLHQLQGKGKGTALFNEIINYAKELKLQELFLLTETAETYFSRRGFHKINRNAVSDELKESVEFKSLCPGSAICMYKKL